MAMPVENKQLGLAIVGPYGNVWTDQLFESTEEAAAYLKNFWKDTPIEWRKWKCVPAEQVITPVSLEYAPIYDLNDSRQEAARRE